MRLPIHVVPIVMLVATAALADEASHRQAAERLLQAIQYERDVQLVNEALMQPVRQGLTSFLDDIDVTPARQAAFDEFVAAYRAIVAEYLSLDTSMQNAASHYVEVFSEEELNGLTQFFSSSLGKRYIDSVPELMQRIGEDSALSATEMMEHLNELVESFKAEIRSMSAP